MKRLLTGLVLAPLVVLGIVFLSDAWFFLVVVVLLDWAALEYVQLARNWVPKAPLAAILLLVPLAAGIALLATTPAAVDGGLWPVLLPLGAGLLVTVIVATLVLFTRTPPKDALPAFGALAFGVPYFALPIFAICRLQEIDPWLLLLGFAIVFLGDTAAFYFGSAFGRHKMAPVVSPNKSWEGAAASFFCALAVAAGWSWWRLGGVSWELLVAVAAAAAAAQIGDLAESMLKRGAGVKDSGSLLPGHGGMFDRIDAVLFAMPTLLAGVLIFGPERFVP